VPAAFGLALQRVRGWCGDAVVVIPHDGADVYPRRVVKPRIIADSRGWSPVA
jgi:hypothetical protein